VKPLDFKVIDRTNLDLINEELKHGEISKSRSR